METRKGAYAPLAKEGPFLIQLGYFFVGVLYYTCSMQYIPP